MPDFSEIRKQILSLAYNHKEGGRYAYVKLLSLTRDLGAAMHDPNDRFLIEKVRDRLNESLCDRFSLAQENFFEGARQKILSAINAHVEAGTARL
jgi:hypothetical protein